MDQSLIIGIGLITVGLVIAAAIMALFVVLIGWRLRSSSKAKQATQSATAANATPEKPANAPAVAAETPAVANAPLKSAPPPVPEELGGRTPVSYFDDDHTDGRHTPSKGMPGPPGNEGAKTELFQRGAHSFEWDDDSEEDECGATEVFSAHHLEEAGVFTIED